MSVNQLAGNLVGQYSGHVLMVGGAPSVPEELETLRAGGFDFDCCLIVSANEHAIHAGLKPHYACVNDDIHSTLQIHQEPRMRALMPTTKLLSRHWWADYRTPQLLACNSGLKGLLYSALLGANPVVVIGIQHYSNGLYFHPDNSRKKNPNLDRGAAYFAKQTTKLKQMLQGVPVRPVSGPLTQLWPKWDPAEKFLPRQLTELELKAQDDAATQRYACTIAPAVAFESALVPERMLFAVTEREMRNIANKDTIVDATGWDWNNVEAGFLDTQAERRAEHARLIKMIGKIRASRRGVRRGVADADLMRLIKWLEAGDSPATVGKRIGLPPEQIRAMASMAGVDITSGAAVVSGLSTVG